MRTVLAFIALSLIASPAAAQYYNPMGGNSIGPGGYSGGYQQQYPMPLPCVFFCPSRKPKDGEMRTTPSGAVFSYDKASNRWILVDRPAGQPRSVYVDRDVYMAR